MPERVWTNNTMNGRLDFLLHSNGIIEVSVDIDNKITRFAISNEDFAAIAEKVVFETPLFVEGDG